MRATKIFRMGTDGLTFRTLRLANMQRLPLFRDAKGRTCHTEVDGSDWSPAQWLQAVVGELGEYANLRKKCERGDLTPEEAKPMLADELADVVIYLDILAARPKHTVAPHAPRLAQSRAKEALEKHARRAEYDSRRFEVQR